MLTVSDVVEILRSQIFLLRIGQADEKISEVSVEVINASRHTS